MLGSVYLTAITVGLLHGLEPGHGWPVAAVYALNRSQRWFQGILAAIVISGAHLVSSFTVVAAFSLLDQWLGITRFGYLDQAAGFILILLAIYIWKHAGKDSHEVSPVAGHAQGEQRTGSLRSDDIASKGLWGLTAFAFALGFAHEEEFSIIALCAGRANCWGLMSAYASSVAASILGATLISIAAFQQLEGKLIDRGRKLLPKLSTLVLGGMGLAYVLGLV